MENNYITIIRPNLTNEEKEKIQAFFAKRKVKSIFSKKQDSEEENIIEEGENNG